MFQEAGQEEDWMWALGMVFEVLQSRQNEALDVLRLEEMPSYHPFSYQTFIEHLLCSRHCAGLWKCAGDPKEHGPFSVCVYSLWEK